MNAKFFTVPILSLAFFFLASHVGLMVPEFFPVPEQVQYLILGSALVPVWLFNLKNKNVRSPNRSIFTRLRLLFYFIFVIAICSTIFAFGTNGSFAMMIRTGAKVIGLFLVYSTLMNCARSFSSQQISRALMIYLVGELSLLYFTNREWNPNAVAARAATAGIVGYYLSSKKSLQFTLLAIGLVVAYRFQCRTVIVATVFSTLMMWFVGRLPRHKEVVFIGVLNVLLLLFAFAGSIKDAATDLAVRSLGSNNPISQFFLSDKSEQKINDDFLDRAEVWELSIGTIRENPLLGVGIGNEVFYNGGRSHNAFLSLAVEGGIISAILWGAFYASIGHFVVFRSEYVEHFGARSLTKLATCLLLYMAMSGMVETSGIASISSPNNLICLFIVFWVISREGRHNIPRSSNSDLKRSPIG